MGTILIIEDDHSIAELERDYLEVHGYAVTLSDNGKQGLEMALSGGWDLIILDIMLPQLDGFTICRKLRDQTDIPILIVSAKRDDIDKVRGLGLGADDFIVKPFSPSELVARVKAHLSRYERLVKRNRNDVADSLVIRGLTMNKGSRSVWVEGKVKVLTAKEFDLLYFLASHPNLVFTKEQLMDTIWGLEAVGDLSTITVHIRKIREKIESDPSHPEYIETLWGVGYRFKSL
ncbi:response regulator transcription factor [Paenibacillus urinalis]|uniref:Response regulator transcription factor n=1 Tax=Paenibacillus urinalis TaxID=521520 RepID=A0AAX3MS36_9BACL|nr:response regulator transcription factor [Paenibacillus urinalis]WDH80388.1 response regulator transcription factor [Paenibacillus urinalis]